jgi:hypothetical protein
MRKYLMRLFRFIIQLFLLLVLYGVKFSFAQTSSHCIAVITEINGKALLKEAGLNQFVKASWGTQLFTGDQVATNDKSEVRLLYSDNSIISLGPNSMITISGIESPATEPMGDVKHSSTGMGINLESLTLRKENSKDVGALAGVRSANMAQPIELQSPGNTLIKTDRPSFSWAATLNYDNYTVKLYNSRGLVWSRKVSEPAMKYPEGEKSLTAGESYFWNVEGEYLVETDKSSNHKFTVLTPEKSGEVSEHETVIRNTFIENPECSSLHSVLGAYYIDMGLLQDAIQQFQAVAEINADAPLPHEILGSLYSEIGEKDKAIEELQKALALTNN